MRSPVNQAIIIAAVPLTLLVAIGGGMAASPRRPTGPAADYPVVVGEPFTIGTTTWTPTDQLNYDAVGFGVIGQGLDGVSAAHKTLPLPSYVEVTRLDTGRSILVRLVERGPMTNEALIGLSEQASQQLGLAQASRSAVRVRRVNPPELERAMLRNGGVAPMRMDTPESLLKVLRRKLAEQSPLLPPPSTPPTMPAHRSVLEALATKRSEAGSVSPAVVPEPKPEIASSPASAPPAAPAPVAAVKGSAAGRADRASGTIKGSHIVQVAAFSSRERADKAARQLKGKVIPAGRLWRLQIGPFMTRGQAASALEKARTAGYSDARIQRSD